MRNGTPPSDGAAKKALRWAWQAIMMPGRMTESLLRLRNLEDLLQSSTTPAPAEPPRQTFDLPPPSSEVYRGYSNEDLAVFDLFRPPEAPRGSTGFVTNFYGVRTRTSFLRGLERADASVSGIPVPTDGYHAEGIEWIGLLKSVTSARRQFTAMELGAGWAPWLVAGAVAAKIRGIQDLTLCGVEADPGHFEFMVEHFRDNGLDPEVHQLIKCGVGTASGRARWPKTDDPSAEWGSRPTISTEIEHTDHIGRHFEQWLDIEVVSISDLLARQPTWDLVHIDVQGWEVELCQTAMKLLNERVRWLIVATHDPKLHGDLLDLVFRNGWSLENEKPPRFNWADGAHNLMAMTIHDGTQVWRNPALTTE
jgi:FkbM family methyltransferase